MRVILRSPGHDPIGVSLAALLSSAEDFLALLALVQLAELLELIAGRLYGSHKLVKDLLG